MFLLYGSIQAAAAGLATFGFALAVANAACSFIYLSKQIAPVVSKQADHVRSYRDCRWRLMEGWMGRICSPSRSSIMHISSSRIKLSAALETKPSAPRLTLVCHDPQIKL
ncbi:hypothetical protein V8C42DRAFT_306352 [Trichoderma barbatum]